MRKNSVFSGIVLIWEDLNSSPVHIDMILQQDRRWIRKNLARTLGLKDPNGDPSATLTTTEKNDLAKSKRVLPFLLSVSFNAFFGRMVHLCMFFTVTYVQTRMQKDIYVV
jgi:hypothetical protein